MISLSSGSKTSVVPNAERLADDWAKDPWIQFMLHGAKPHGHCLDDILSFDRGAFDTNHDFVQWLFPNREPSPVNPSAPLLTERHVLAFLTMPELRAKVDQASAKFLDFLGLREVAGGIEQTDDFAQGSQYWLRPMDHNHRRISRFFLFLCDMGQKERAATLLVYLKAALATAELGDIDAVNYWRNIVTKV